MIATMSSVSLPVTRPTGRALLIGSAACRSQPMQILQRLGFQCAEVDDPYSAMTELCRRPLVYRAVILSLAGLYREELALIEAVKRRFPHIEIWLSQTDGRQASLAEAMRLGADGLVADDGMHRTAIGAPMTSAPLPPPPPTMAMRPVAPQTAVEDEEFHEATPSAGADETVAGAPADENVAEPVLTADELRALLQDQPPLPPSGGRQERGGA
jgi:hypothetical protein